MALMQQSKNRLLNPTCPAAAVAAVRHQRSNSHDMPCSLGHLQQALLQREQELMLRVQ
jgi:hypothetical protein